MGRKKKKKLKRRAYVADMLLSRALENLGTTWTERLRPSFRDERRDLDKLVEKLTKEGTVDIYPEDFLADNYAAIEQTEQILVALFVVAVYHMFEQHMIYGFYRWAMRYHGKTPSNRPQLHDVVRSFKAAWSVDLTKLRSWKEIEDLRLVANFIKHGEDGNESLRKSHSDWFKSEQSALALGAFGVEIPAAYLDQAIAAVKKFFRELQMTLAATSPA